MRGIRLHAICAVAVISIFGFLYTSYHINIVERFTSNRTKTNLLLVSNNLAVNSNISVSNSLPISNEPPPNNKLFLYLIQGASCLSSYHLQNEVLGGGKTHDVLFLSYKGKCLKHSSHPNHITYISSENKTTWTSGRNLLFRHVTEHLSYTSKDYLYYIFMDEDIKLINNNMAQKLFGKEANTIYSETISPWRKFEIFLSSYKPAVGFLDNEAQLRRHKFYKGPLKPYYGEIWYDAQINAFHRDAMRNLLPYNDKSDKESWWISQAFIQCKSLYRYYGHVIVFIPVLAVNDAHKDYPRGLSMEHYKAECQEEYNRAPNYIKQLVLADKMLNITSRNDLPSFLEHIAPPGTTVKKYQYIHW